MAKTTISGPSVVLGPLMGAPWVAGSSMPGPQEYSLEMGPSIEYQADGFPDPRQSGNKDNPGIGEIQTHFHTPNVVGYDCVPAVSNQALTVAGNAVSGTPFVNISAFVQGVSPNCPLINAANGQLVTGVAPYAGPIAGAGPVIGLDIGWGYLNVPGGSNATLTLPVPTNVLPSQVYRFTPGQWIALGGCGPGGATFFTQVTAVNAAAGTITVSPVPPTANAAAPVGGTNQLNPFAYGNPAPIAYSPRLGGGVGAWLDPSQCLMRGFGVTGVASGTGGPVTIRSYDCYGYPQSETITATAGATTVWGKKTGKWFHSATPQFNDAHNYTVVTSDVFGFPFRSDLWENCTFFWNGQFLTGVSAGTGFQWSQADATNPATLTTGDVRGSMQVSARGPNAGVTATTYPDGATRRLTVFQVLPLHAMINANQFSALSIYGVPPFAN